MTRTAAQGVGMGVLPGVYEVSASIAWETNGGGIRVVRLLRNGTEIAQASVPNTGFTTQTISKVVRMQAGQFAQVQGLQDGAVTLDIEKQDEFSPESALTWLAPGP